MAGYSTTIRAGRLQFVADTIDGGAGPGLLRVYDGTRPATGGSATTLLAELTLSDPCATVSGTTLTFSSITADASANATGTATWGRIVTSAGTFCVDVSVSATGGGGEFQLSSTSITAGQQVTCTSGTITAGNA